MEEVNAPMEVDAQEEVAEPLELEILEDTDSKSLLPALLLGAGAGIVGASLGLFIMSAFFSAAEAPAEPAAEPAQIEQSAAPKTAPTNAPSHGGFYLQVGAYRNVEGAERLAGQLRAEGFDVVVKQSGAFHRLIVGPSASPEGIEGISRRLVAVADGINLDLPAAWISLGPVEESNL